jgi:hypothetical protein
MALAIVGGLDPPENRAKIMIDEVRGDSYPMVADCARWLRLNRPDLAGRWGAYLVNGTNVGYPGLQPAIDELLDARAMIACEMYAKQSDYNAAGDTKGERDTWLGDFYRGSRGEFPQGRLHWLVERRKSRSSDSHISALLGVIDKFVTDYVFMDRCFYVFVNRSGYRGLALASNGGLGSYKWDRDGMSSTSRDVRFATSWDWYCGLGKTTLNPN